MEAKAEKAFSGGMMGQATIAAIIASMQNDCDCKTCSILRKVGTKMIQEFE